jgi:hypothetical protein
MLTKEQVGDYVVRNGLDERTQRREIAYQRFMLSDYCRGVFTALTLQDIAELIGYDKHDMVIYGIKQHEKFKNDRLYKEINSELYKLLYDEEIIIVGDLKTDILKAESLIELHQIQNNIKIGLY